jgi:hypothetical protein
MIDFNKTTLLEQLKKDFGWKIDSVTLWTYEQKKFIAPSSYMSNGKRLVPIYYASDYQYIVNVLQLLHKLGKIRIKGYDKNKNQKEESKTVSEAKS